MAVLVDFELITQASSSPSMHFKNRSLTVLFLIMLSLASIPIAFSVCYVSQILDFIYVICQPQLWVEAKRFLTQPVLFLLVNGIVLCIWISSGAASICPSEFWNYNCNSDVMKEAKAQSPGIAANGKLPSLSFSPDNENKAEPSVDCDLRASKVAPIQALSSATNGISVQKLDCSPEKRDHKSGRFIDRTDSETKKYPKKTNFQEKTRSLPSHAIVSKVPARETKADPSGESNCKKEVLVMEVDELNERIDAFFARFRERMRLESLRCQ